jgi:hypothetical protein
MERWWNSKWQGKTEMFGERAVPLPLCPPHIARGLLIPAPPSYYPYLCGFRGLILRCHLCDECRSSERACRSGSGSPEIRSGRSQGCDGSSCWMMVVHGHDITLEKSDSSVGFDTSRVNYRLQDRAHSRTVTCLWATYHWSEKSDYC